MIDQQADDVIAEAKDFLEVHRGVDNRKYPIRLGLVRALVERVSRQPQEVDGELLDRLEELAVWLDENAPVGHSTPWLVRRDLVREAGRQLAASVSHQPVDAPIAPVVVNSQQEPPKEPALRQALKEIRYICRDVELGNWFAPDAIEHIIVACESVDDQPAAEGSQPVLRRDPCGCLHDGSRIVEWCTRSGQTDEGHEERNKETL